MNNLRLNKRFYLKEALNLALSAFKEAAIELKEESSYYNLYFGCDDEKIKYEFANYVLCLMK